LIIFVISTDEMKLISVFTCWRT